MERPSTARSRSGAWEWLAPVGPYTQVLTWKVGASSPTTLTFDQKTHVDPCVSGNRVVWLDYDDDFDGQVYSAVPVCSLTIKTSASSCKVGKQFVLSGLGTPSPALVGRMMHVDVKKPGKSYWSYSSNRIVYAGAGGAASWQYKYTLKSGMAKGTYQFRAVYDADDWYAGYTSTAVKVVAK